MKKYEITIKTNIEFTKTIEAESKYKAVSLALDTLDGTYFKNCGMHDHPHNTKEYLRTDDIVACTEIETKKPLILLCGKSGSGKTTVADLLQSKYGLKELLSYTTRPRRSDDEGGHLFVDTPTFTQHKKEDRIAADTTINGYKYWTTKEQLDSADVYVIDPKTALELEKKIKDERDVIIVYLCCPETTRVYRMAKRGDSLAGIKTRLCIEDSWKDNWDDYIATFNYKRQRFDSGEHNSEYIASAIMLIYNFCLTGKRI
jgi:guanylate kinase